MSQQSMCEVPAQVTIEKVELELIIKALYDCYGYDFKQYQTASLKRRMVALKEKHQLNHLWELLPKILYQPELLDSMITQLSVGVTELFRDPWTYAAINEHVFPLLHSYPNPKIWHAGCSTGEEVFSLAILLKEAGLFNNVQIYATDFNKHSLDIASNGMLNNGLTSQDITNYQQAGGRLSLGDYFTSAYEKSKLDRKILKKMSFNEHNLVHDQAFCEAHVILCRNVLIYFNRDLQDKVLELFMRSLVRGGYLILGPKETLATSSVNAHFKLIDATAKIYQKVSL